MIKLFLPAIILFFSMDSASAQQKNHRIIYLFSTEAGNASFIAQKSFFSKDAAGLKERAIEVHEMIGLKANESIFKKYKTSAQSFTFILFGKDGGEKMRSNEPVSLEKLYRTIDAMPMRQNEMKQQGKP